MQNVLTQSAAAMRMYADEVVKGRLPDPLHAAMVLGNGDDSANEYIAWYGA